MWIERKNPWYSENKYNVGCIIHSEDPYRACAYDKTQSLGFSEPVSQWTDFQALRIEKHEIRVLYFSLVFPTIFTLSL